MQSVRAVNRLMCGEDFVSGQSDLANWKPVEAN